MARALRVNVKDGWYHVMARGIDGKAIYTDARDREHFLELVEEMHARYRILIHAYVLMNSHYHLVLQTPDANISQSMHWLNAGYGIWFNKRHERVGPVFQGRFKSVPVEGGAWAYELSLYVHLNPVRIKAYGLSKLDRKIESRCPVLQLSKEDVALRLKRLRTYKWSSYRFYAGYERCPGWLETRSLLGRAHKQPSRQRLFYRKDVSDRLRCGVEEAVWEKLKNGFALGSEVFAEQLRKNAGVVLREYTQKTELRPKVDLPVVIKTVEAVKGEAWEQFAFRHGDWGLALAMWAARRFCGMTLREIGEAMGGMDYAAVAMAIRRFEKDCDENRLMRTAQDRTENILMSLCPMKNE